MMWKTWKTIKKGKYLYAKIPEHPAATKHGYVLEHRIVMENMLGRLLHSDEIVHHKDGDTKNNAPNNLELMLAIVHCKKHGIERSRRVEISCAYCKKKYSITCGQYKFRLKTGQKNFCCSRKCNGKLNGGHEKDIDNLIISELKLGKSAYRIAKDNGLIVQTVLNHMRRKDLSSK